MSITEDLFIFESESSSEKNSFDNVTFAICANVKTYSESVELNVSYAVMEILVAIFAVLGNGLVILVFFLKRRLRRRTNYYIVSLAVADLLFGLFGIPIAILISVGIPQSCFMCLLATSVLLVFCTVSIFSLLLISFDRFISILYPLQYAKIQSWVTIEIAACWVLGGVVGFLPLGWHVELPITRCFYHDVVTEGYQMFRFVFVILAPAVLIFMIYGMIYKIVLHQRRKEKILKPTSCCPSESQTCIDHRIKREFKATLNIFIIVLFFMVCWFPLNIVKSIKISCTTCNIPDNFITYGIVLTHFNSAINPLMYAYHLRDFRHEILKLLGCRRREAPISY